MKRLVSILQGLIAGALLVVSGMVGAQLIYGNTFPFWNVNGPLVVTGQTTLSGGTAITGTTTIGAGATFTNPSLTGTTTNDSAAVGILGEYMASTLTQGQALVGAASTTAKNVTSVTLTAGDWDVRANCDFLTASFVATALSCGLGTTTGTQASQAGGSGIAADPLTIQNFASQTIPDSVSVLHIGPTRVSIAASTPIYLVAKNTWGSGSHSLFGTISARRVR